jgi:uncharacterized damage-inducible protein DinB
MKSIACTLLLASCVFAQDNPLSSGMKMMYGMGRTNILKAAEKMPEENYAYKPTDSVRSFGQLVGHVADAQYLFCSPVAGTNTPPPGVEKSKTSKADLVQALRDAFAFCDKAYDSLADAQAADKVKFFGRDSTKLNVLSFNNMHNYEHYGNMVTYMRMKNLVPPSSESQGPPPAKKQ